MTLRAVLGKQLTMAVSVNMIYIAIYYKNEANMKRAS